ncbi:MAG TPA: amidohydrolase family protein [Anaerolineae bacterium]|nr:amidohydrolase family protein [Anaerolineae bacterium]
MIVDAHLHIWRATTSYPNPSATHVSPYSDVPLELLKEYMAEYDVARAVLVQPLYPGEDNSYIADAAAREPDTFAAVCVVDPRLPEAPERLAYWVKERGCRGLRIRPRIAGEAECFGHPSTFPLWERARALNVVVNVLANPEHLATVGALAERFSDVPILIDHMAHPNVAAGVNSPGFQLLLDLARYPRVFVKVTGYYYYSQESYPWRDCWDFVRAVYDRFGAERMIWGSDFPHVLLKAGYRRNLMLPERYFSFLTPTERALYMGENANKLYFQSTRQT